MHKDLWGRCLAVTFFFMEIILYVQSCLLLAAREEVLFWEASGLSRTLALLGGSQPRRDKVLDSITPYLFRSLVFRL